MHANLVSLRFILRICVSKCNCLTFKNYSNLPQNLFQNSLCQRETWDTPCDFAHSFMVINLCYYKFLKGQAMTQTSSASLDKHILWIPLILAIFTEVYRYPQLSTVTVSITSLEKKRIVTPPPLTISYFTMLPSVKKI